MAGGVRPNYALRRIVVLVIALVVIGGVGAAIALASSGRSDSAGDGAAPSATPRWENEAPPSSPAPEPTVAPAAPSCDPRIVGALINKRSPICPLDFVPELVTVPSTGGELQPAAAAAMDALVAGLEAATGFGVYSVSAYRSFDTQVSTYAGWVELDGQEAADRYSARPGHSEHQSGLAMDLAAASCDCTDEPFGATPEGIWIAANAWRYGYIVRYPDGYEAITGYIWEPWHLRYVGPEIAAAMHERGIATLEEYYGTGPAPDYG